ncbi:MAG: aspartate-semialdehyde dehydrogenase [Desulfurococcales archaeon]|nr:aspartate-semialdehyde dehydrogenase [Desulfurococcales archaeon]
MDKLRVGVLGATGLVGQVFVDILARHPWFEVKALAASPGKRGLRYAEAVSWRLEGEPPEAVKDIRLVEPTPAGFSGEGLDIVFSAIPSSVAESVEVELVKSGFTVISNASNMRMERDIPLVVPEINPDHLDLIRIQGKTRGWRGVLVKNPNCSSAILSLPLKPLLDNFGVKRVFVTTLQALSGAGYTGVPSMAILDNIIPYIKREEDKIESEPLKILGKLRRDAIETPGISITATATRVPVLHGHLESVTLELASTPDIEEIKATMAKFRGKPQELNLPTAPRNPIIVLEGEDRPQPRLDRNAGAGMSVTVGRVRKVGSRDDSWYRFLVLGHNLVRGAAGNAVLIAELMLKTGFI